MNIQSIRAADTCMAITEWAADMCFDYVPYDKK